MQNLIVNSVTKKSVWLNASEAKALYRGIVVAGQGFNKTNWHNDIAIFFSEHQPKLVGDGAAGFDITYMGWSREHFYVQRAFILEVLQQTILDKSWNNYMISIDNDVAAHKTRELIGLFEDLKIEDIHPGPVPFHFRAPDAAEYKYCKVHQNIVLNDAEFAPSLNCIVCGTTETEENIGLVIKEIELEGEWKERFCLEVIPDVALESRLQVYKIADRICRQKDMVLLGNKWLEVNFEWAQQCIRDGFTYDLAYQSKIDSDEINSRNIEKVETLVQNQNIICCLSNSEHQPWRSDYNGRRHEHLLSAYSFGYPYAFSFGYVIGCRNKVIFTFFYGDS